MRMTGVRRRGQGSIKGEQKRKKKKEKRLSACQAAPEETAERVD